MYDSNKAERVIRFIERVCTHVKGDLASQSFLLEEWQKDYIRDLFGTVNKNGTRQYRTSFVFIPSLVCTRIKKAGAQPQRLGIAERYLSANHAALLEFFNAVPDGGFG